MSSPPAEPADPTREEPWATQPVRGQVSPEPEPEFGPAADPQPELAPQRAEETEPYDAVLLLSFGGPEAPEEVVPFLRRVTRGRGIPDERLAEVGEHYYRFGGRSPINDLNRDLLAALTAELTRRGIDVPVLWANRFSEPFLPDTLRTAYDEGMSSLVVVTTSAYSSYSSCRAYREDLAAAIEELAGEGRTVRVDKVRPYFNHPGFAATNTALTTEAVREMLERTGALPHLVFVTHSVPEAMDDTSGPGDAPGNVYSSQHQALAAAIAEEVGVTLDGTLSWDLAYCSRSGPPSQAWLEPDVNDHLATLAGEGVSHVVLVPIGFVSDHMEVVFDLDTEAADTARELGLDLVRVPTVGPAPEFVSGLVDLVLERSAQACQEPVDAPAWPVPEPLPAVCPAGCCPNLRTAKPAVCGID